MLASCAEGHKLSVCVLLSGERERERERGGETKMIPAKKYYAVCESALKDGKKNASFHIDNNYRR